ncbi:hypothetical protein [Pleomorphovibrio marinus]|nr:hypothetical protein [Pleomorphovibrio marinus]
MKIKIFGQGRESRAPEEPAAAPRSPEGEVHPLRQKVSSNGFF